MFWIGETCNNITSTSIETVERYSIETVERYSIETVERYSIETVERYSIETVERYNLRSNPTQPTKNYNYVLRSIYIYIYGFPKKNLAYFFAWVDRSWTCNIRRFQYFFFFFLLLT